MSGLSHLPMEHVDVLLSRLGLALVDSCQINSGKIKQSGDFVANGMGEMTGGVPVQQLAAGFGTQSINTVLFFPPFHKSYSSAVGSQQIKTVSKYKRSFIQELFNKGVTSIVDFKSFSEVIVRKVIEGFVS